MQGLQVEDDLVNEYRWNDDEASRVLLIIEPVPTVSHLSGLMYLFSTELVCILHRESLRRLHIRLHKCHRCPILDPAAPGTPSSR